MKGSSSIPTADPAVLRAALNFYGNGIMLFECLRNAKGDIQDFRLTLANQQAEELIGMTEATMLNRTASDLFSAAFRNELWTYARHVVDTGEIARTQINFPIPGTQERWFELTFQKYGDGAAISFADITALKKAALAAQEQSELLDSILNGSLNGVICYQAIRDEHDQICDFRATRWNPAALRMTHQTEADLSNYTLLERYPERALPGNSGYDLFQTYIQTITTGTPWHHEVYMDSGDAWFNVSVSKLGDGVLVNFLDITPAKRYENQLQHTIEELQQSNKNLEQFAYVASHDLQEPLRKITTFGNILQSHTEIGTENTALLNRMQSAAQRMNVLIQDLLAYSRLTSTKAPFQRVNLQDVLNDVLNDLETVIQEKRAEVDSTSLPTVAGEAMQLRQVLQNLLSNALKFSKPGISPRITIDCKQLTGQTIRPLSGQTIATADLDKPFYAISIQDNGIGFEEKYTSQIFTVFQRLHNRSQYQGTGIGLAIVQKVVENHKGYLSVSSQPDQGATFTVYLPAEPAPFVLTR
ncbi:Phytochrome-like protein cph1 [Fibrisoma limi BUZ 3]|uniref:histidine kinase n=1 Tax=Fibrisoma limi BUZ 3 TaxID=1185876 RepID=I2GPT1_9BACT|nr:PAS domain-containing sensor histidine kinase [Fibrisoma limi]CCH55909.1 Phytochrome-like protein cph1 [Fibrisoma limi BUZ 3]